MNILILGSGGREHTFAYKISKSAKCNKLYVAPGNAGTSDIATNIPIVVTDFKAIKKCVIEHQITLVVVGPEDPLVKGNCRFFPLRFRVKRGTTYWAFKGRSSS